MAMKIPTQFPSDRMQVVASLTGLLGTTPHPAQQFMTQPEESSPSALSILPSLKVILDYEGPPCRSFWVFPRLLVSVKMVPCINSGLTEHQNSKDGRIW